MVLLFMVNMTVVTLVTRRPCRPAVAVETHARGAKKSNAPATVHELETLASDQFLTRGNPKEVEEGHKEESRPRSRQNEETKTESVEQSEGFFKLKASLTAMWLPAVVGDNTGTCSSPPPSPPWSPRSWC